MDNFILMPDGTTKMVDLSKNNQLFPVSWVEDTYRFGLNDEGARKAYAYSVLMHRCITVKANTLSTLPKRFVNAEEQDISKRHVVRKALGRRRTKLWNTISRDWDIFGRIFLEPVRNPKTGNTYFKRINPFTMEVIRDETGIAAFMQRINGAEVNRWEPHELVYIWDYDPNDDLMGLPPTQYILKNVVTELALTDFVKAYFENGGTPAGILTTDQLLRPNQTKEYAQEWKSNYGGANNSNKVAVLGGGLSYQQLTPTIKEMVVDTVGKTNAKRIAQIYGVPLSLVLEEAEENRATATESRKSFYTETIIPTFQFLGDEISEQAIPFITTEEIFLEADLFRIDVLQNDRQIITERSTVGFKSGVRMLNEARKLEQLPTIPGGDVLFLGGRLLPASALENTEELNRILAGEPLNQSFEPNETEPINPDPDKQSNRLRKSHQFGKSIITYSKIAIATELKNWRKKALNKGVDSNFDTDVIPEAIQEFIEIDLQYTKDNPDKVKAVFDKYIDLFENGLTTEQEFEALFQQNDYWKGIGYYQKRVKRLFEDHYFNGLLDELLNYVDSHESYIGIDGILDERERKLVDLLIPLAYEITLAGMNKGYQLVGEEPTGKNITDTIQKLYKKSEQFARDFAKNINETTKNIFTEKLQEWIDSGGIVSNFTQFMRGVLDEMPDNFVVDKLRWLFSEERSSRFGEDFGYGLYGEGVLESYDDLGKAAVWRTALDERVCSICRPLEGVMGTINEGFVSPADNQVYYPGRAHSKCRCSAYPTDPANMGILD